MILATVSGSLRNGSSNHRLLEAVRLTAPTPVIVEPPFPLDHLPYFNPDVESAGLPESARAWRETVGRCDAILISSPEYVHGIPGVLKNALDWLVGGMEMDGKPFVLLNASPPGDYVRAGLLEILGVMGGRFVEAASLEFPLRGDRRSAAEIASDPVFGPRLQGLFKTLTETLATAVSAQNT